MELATVCREIKDVSCCLKETPRKTFEKMSGFTKAFIQDNNNFNTSALSHQNKSKLQMCKLLMKVNISKVQNVESMIININSALNLRYKPLSYTQSSLFCEVAGCRAATTLKVVNFTVTIHGFSSHGQNIYSAEVPQTMFFTCGENP